MKGRRGKEAVVFKTIPLVPTKSQINTAFVGIAVLGAVTVLIPGFFFISAFLLPVLICPLFGKPDKKTAIALILYSLLPAVAAFIQSGDAKLTLCILCPSTGGLLTQAPDPHLGQNVCLGTMVPAVCVVLRECRCSPPRRKGLSDSSRASAGRSQGWSGARSFWIVLHQVVDQAWIHSCGRSSSSSF